MTIEANRVEKVTLSKRQLMLDKVELGLSNEQQAAKYGISVGQIKLAQKMAGLDGLRPKKVDFILEDDFTENDASLLSDITGVETSIVEEAVAEPQIEEQPMTEESTEEEPVNTEAIATEVMEPTNGTDLF